MKSGRTFHVFLKGWHPTQRIGGDAIEESNLANGIQFPMIGSSAMLTESATDKSKVSSVKFPVRPFNQSNLANWLLAVVEFYQKLSEVDRYALTYIDFIQRNFNSWYNHDIGPPVLPQNQLKTTTWDQVPFETPAPLEIDSSPLLTSLSTLLPTTPTTPVAPPLTPRPTTPQMVFTPKPPPMVPMVPMGSMTGGQSGSPLIGRLTGATCEETFGEASVGLFLFPGSKIRNGSLCGGNSLVWPVGYLLRAFPSLSMLNLRHRVTDILRSAPKLQSPLTVYFGVRADRVDFEAVHGLSPYKGESSSLITSMHVPDDGYILLDTDPKRAISRARQVNDHKDLKYVALRVTLTSGMSALPIVMPTFGNDLAGVMPIAVPNDFLRLGKVAPNEIRSKCKMLQYPKPHRECVQYPEQALEFIDERKQEPPLPAKSRAEMTWPALPSVSIQPPIASFQDVPLDLFLPDKVPAGCESNRWTYFLKLLANNFGLSKNKLAVCIPGGELFDDAPESENTFPSKKFNDPALEGYRTGEIKTGLDAFVYRSDLANSGITLVNPEIEKDLPLEASKKLFWYKYPGSTVPPSVKQLSTPCSSPFTIAPLKLVSFLPSSSGERYLRGWSGHANALIIDHRRKIIERFEPHGERTGSELLNFADRLLPTVLGRVLPGYRYEIPSASCPVLGPQALSGEGDPEVKAQGYCQCWALLYVSLRIMNPDWNGHQIIQQMNRSGLNNTIYFLPPLTQHIFPRPVLPRHWQSLGLVPIKQHRMFLTSYIQAFMHFYNIATKADEFA